MARYTGIPARVLPHRPSRPYLGGGSSLRAARAGAAGRAQPGPGAAPRASTRSARPAGQGLAPAPLPPEPGRAGAAPPRAGQRSPPAGGPCAPRSHPSQRRSRRSPAQGTAEGTQVRASRSSTSAGARTGREGWSGPAGRQHEWSAAAVPWQSSPRAAVDPPLPLLCSQPQATIPTQAVCHVLRGDGW